MHIPDEVGAGLDILRIEGDDMGIHVQLFLQQRIIGRGTTDDLAIPAKTDGEVEVGPEIGLHLRKKSQFDEGYTYFRICPIEGDLAVEAVGIVVLQVLDARIIELTLLVMRKAVR